MTRMSPREIERALEQFDGGDDDPDPLVGIEQPNGDLLDADGEPVDDPPIRIPRRVADVWTRYP